MKPSDMEVGKKYRSLNSDFVCTVKYISDTVLVVKWDHHEGDSPYNTDKGRHEFCWVEVTEPLYGIVYHTKFSEKRHLVGFIFSSVEAAKKYSEYYSWMRDVSIVELTKVT